MLPKTDQRKSGALELRFRHYEHGVVKLCLARMVNFLLHLSCFKSDGYYPKITSHYLASPLA